MSTRDNVGDCVATHGMDLFESIAFVIIITMILIGFVVKCCELGV
jgi:Na+/H+-translocating membrane pyrophosphatase